MRDEQGRRRWGPVAVVLLLLMLPPAYPLSLGPMIFTYNALGKPAWMEFLDVVYAPLDRLPEPFQSILDRYVDAWRW